MILEACIDFMQQLEIILDFSETTDNNIAEFQVKETVEPGTSVLQKTEIKKFKYWNFEYDLDRKTNCPAFFLLQLQQGESFSNCV